MPASRSRTERWLDCLHQIFERNGGLEVSVVTGDAKDPPPEPHADLVWRVRILRLTESEIVVERPAAMGHTFAIATGSLITAVMCVGQNRWMFRTRVLGTDRSSPLGGLRLALPSRVERCMRRDFLRVSAASLTLPRVTCWPLLDPASVVAPEVANRNAILAMEAPGRHAVNVGCAGSPGAGEVLPLVAPPFHAQLMNLGGGGVGLLIAKDERVSLDRSSALWLRIDLSPHVPVPLAMTARVVHTHLDSSQSMYVGAAFDFSFHAAHREFVVGQIARCIGAIVPKSLAA